jgi:hypothetical protein
MYDAYAFVFSVTAEQRTQDIILTDQDEMGCRMPHKELDSRRNRH